MLFTPKALSSVTLDKEILSQDKETAFSAGPCSLGKKALFLGSYFLSNSRYVPLTRVERVFKRLAVTRGFYEGKVFGTLAYLVVLHDGGQEAVCRFDHEEELDELLNAFRARTRIPVGKP